MNKIQNKKCEISTAFLISIIILILGFVILLVFLYNVYWNQNADSATCHESVILRATMPSLVQNYVPLKCRTNKICVTTGLIGGDCENLKGETGITKVKVSSGDKGVEEINKLYAQNIVNCWSMMGEGKLSLFQQKLAVDYGMGDVYPTCVICNRIAFDTKSLEKAGVDLTKINPTEYMLTHLVQNTNQTYFGYIAGGDGKFSVAESLLKTSDTTLSCKLSTEKTDPADNSPICVSQDQINAYNEAQANIQAVDKASADFNYKTDSNAILFMQISAPKNGDVFMNTLNAAAGMLLSSFALAPGTTLKGIGTLFVKSPITSIPATDVVWKGVDYSGMYGKSFKWVGGVISKTGIIAVAVAVIGLSAQQINVEWQKSVTASKCSDVQMGSSMYEGCSVVRAVPYNEQDISSYCAVIESIP